MSVPQSARAIRAIATAVASHADDPAALTRALQVPFGELLALPDLRAKGVPRAGNHVANSFYLYYDGDLSILLFELPKGKRIPAHDHGNWETMGIYSGAVKHTVYERTDDGAVDGKATLRVVDDRTLMPGDTALVAPPADIHSFMATVDDTWGITVAAGTYHAQRSYYDPENGTVVKKKPR